MSGRGGFTLIEVLVAMTILVIIFTIVFGTFFYTVNNAEEQEERAALYHRASYILNDISRTVSSAFVPFGGTFPAEEEEKPIFLGEMNQIADHEISTLSAFTTNRFYSARGDVQDIAYVSYEVTEPGDIDSIGWIKDENNPLVLKSEAETLFLEAENTDEKKPLWALNISSLDIEYFDGSGWLSTWDYEEQKTLPVAVRMNLELADSNSSTHSFSTIAFVHVNTLLEETPEDLDEELEENKQET